MCSVVVSGEQMGRTIELFFIFPPREATLSGEEEGRKKEMQEGREGPGTGWDQASLFPLGKKALLGEHQARAQVARAHTYPKPCSSSAYKANTPFAFHPAACQVQKSLLDTYSGIVVTHLCPSQAPQAGHTGQLHPC